MLASLSTDQRERKREFFIFLHLVLIRRPVWMSVFSKKKISRSYYIIRYISLYRRIIISLSIFLEYIIDIKYRINAARGGGERLEGSSTVLEDAFRCSLIRIGGEEKEGRVVARSRPARRGNNYSDVDRGRVTRALMLADGVCVCVQVGELQRREGSETGETDHEARLPHGYNPELLNDIHAGQR